MLFKADKLLIQYMLLGCLLSACGGESRIAQSALTMNSPQPIVSHEASTSSPTSGVGTPSQASTALMSPEQKNRFTSLWANVATQYRPGKNSQYILPSDTTIAQPYIVGDKGNVLASVSVAHGGRSAAYGTNVLDDFSDNKLAHAPAFKRLVAWLVHGAPDAQFKSPLSVAWVGLYSEEGAKGLAKAGLNARSVTCDFIVSATCSNKADLLIIGSDVTVSRSLDRKISNLVQAGHPVLYLHTDGSASSESAALVLSGMGMKLGAYGGNYFTLDEVAPQSTSTTMALSPPPLKGRKGDQHTQL